MLSVLFLFLVLEISTLSEGQQFLNNVSGEVQEGNFTYYSMSYDGTILLHLTSITGDCDLYVSQHTNTPSYEPQSNCLQSVTCGIDAVIVPESFKRPIGIGIFGHPSHAVSSYNLIFYKLDDSQDIYDPFDESLQIPIQRKIEDSDSISSKPKEDKFEFLYHYLWVFFVNLMEELITL